MQLDSSRIFDPPTIGTTYLLRVSPPARPFLGILTDGNAALAINSRKRMIKMDSFLSSFPRKVHPEYWILEDNWAVVYDPRRETFFWMNENAKRISRRFDASERLGDIMSERIPRLPQTKAKEYFRETIRFTYLLYELRLIRLMKKTRP